MKSSSVGIRRVFVISISMFAVALSGIVLQGAENKKPQLCQGNYHSRGGRQRAACQVCPQLLQPD